MFVSLILMFVVGPVRQQTVAIRHDTTVPVTRRQPLEPADAEKPKLSAGDAAVTISPKSKDWVVLCANPKVLKELALVEGTAKAQDQIDLGEDSGIMVMLPADTPVMVVSTETLDLPNRSVTMIKVRVDDQDNRGRIGWLLEDSLRPIKYVASR